MKAQGSYRCSMFVGLLILQGSATALLRAEEPSNQPQYSPDRVVLVSEPVDVPMEFVDGQPMVSVTINGAGPFRMLLDTTATANILDDDVAREARLKVTGQIKLDDELYSQAARADIVRIKKLSICDATFSGFDAVAVDLDKLYEGKRRYDGILSLAVFARGLVSLDFPNKSVVIENGELAFDDGETIFEYTDSADGPTIKLTFDSINVKVGIDTRSPGACTFPKALKLKVALGYEPGKGSSGFAIITDMDVREPTIKAMVHIGSYELMTVPVAFKDDHSFIGRKILEHFVVSFDLRNHRVQFMRGERYPINLSPRPRFGIDLLRQGSNLRVIAIFPDSAIAQSSVIKLGDKISAINGRPIGQFSSEVLSDILKKNVVVTFTVMRSGLPLLVPIDAMVN